MLTDDEKRFIIYWKEHRDIEKKTFKQWLVGLPLGLLFGIPILINFFAGWYKRANMDLNAQLSNHEFNPLVLIIAFLLIVSFMAIFSKRHKWEMHEQKYRELIARQEKKLSSNAAKGVRLQSYKDIFAKFLIMRKFLLIALAAVIFLASACLKGSNSNSFTCSYDACALKAPDSEIVRLQDYITTNGITATKHCSGLFYTIVTDGTGGSPTACSDVAINYTGAFTNGNVFDKSTAPVAFNLQSLITGWKNGLPLLKKGGKIKLYIPPSLGYGPNQYQTIPGNSILVFDIELLDYQ